MSQCALSFCKRSYEGYVVKVCHICMDPVVVCPTCFDEYEKIICPECTEQAIRDGSVDDLKALVEKT